MGKFYLITTAVLIFFASASLADFYISPDGSDTNPGTQARPFQTLNQARLAVREVNSDMKEDIVVFIAPGEYFFDEPVVFTTADSGTNGYKVLYRNQGQIGSARFVGGRQIKGFKRVGNAWQVDVGKNTFHTLYQNHKRLHKARYPNYIHNEQFPTAHAPYFVSVTGSPLSKPPVPSWLTYNPAEVDLEGIDVGQMKINIFPWGKCNWHRWNCAVTGIDTANHKITFDNMNDGTQIEDRARFYLEDHETFLDDPGEFYLDPETGRLCLIPYPGEQSNPDRLNIVMPLTHDIIRLAGDSIQNPIHDITFEGLALEYTDGVSPLRFWWQLAWGRNDHALIWMNNAAKIEIRNCHLKNSGRHGIMMAGGNNNNKVYGCWVEQMGINGIAMSNFATKDAKNETVTHNIISNCKVHDIGQLGLYASCTTIMGGSYNEISYCELFNSPRYANTMRGNITAKNTRGAEARENPKASKSTDNQFKYLRIYDCGQDSGDMGAIHSCQVNLEGGEYINQYEQITIDNTRAVEGMNDIPPDGIFLDWPGMTMHQRFKDFHIVNSQGQQFRSNGHANAASAVTENVSWKPGFDGSRMQYEKIGLKDDFPKVYGERERKTAPGMVENFKAEAISDTAIKLTWQPPAENKNQQLVYTIYRNDMPWQTTEKTALVNHNLTELQSCNYRISAQNGPLGPLGKLSQSITATTLPDTTPPEIAAAFTVQGQKAIIASFTEPVEKTSAQNLSNYRINADARIVDIKYDTAAPQRITLTLDKALPENQKFTLTARKIKDMAAHPNTMAGRSSKTFTTLSLTAYYPMDETQGQIVHDISGNENKGKIVGNCDWLPNKGIIGGALKLDGVSGYAVCSEKANLGPGDFTIAAWINRNAQDTNIFLSKGNGFGSNQQWSLGWAYPVGSGSVSMRYNGQYWATAEKSVPKGIWTHIAFVRKGKIGHTYVNGKRSGDPHNLSKMGELVNDRPLLIGRREHEPSPAMFSGMIDDIRIYNQALDPAQILALAQRDAEK